MPNNKANNMPVNFFMYKTTYKNYAILLATFAAVAVAAEHLAVVGNGAAAFDPRRNMVGFHLFDFEMFAAKRTNAVLALIDFALGVVIERTNTQMVDVMVKDIMENA